MKILVIGPEGQLGWELQRTLACLGDVVALGRKSKQQIVDLTDFSTIEAAVQEIRPQLVVNTAAYTAVDKAEQDADLAYRVNGEAPAVLAQAAESVGAGIIHYSTDYVFDGNVENPYTENDETNPQNVYGGSKLQGEIAIQQSVNNFLILRTAWVYGGRGNNFLLTMLRLLKERDLLTIVDDQFGAPTWTRIIAECTAHIVKQCCEQGKFKAASRSGIYHLTCQGQTSWYGFASRIAELAKQEGLLNEPHAKLESIPTSEYPTPAKRPGYSVLCNDKLKEVFGLSVPSWEQILELCLADIASRMIAS